MFEVIELSKISNADLGALSFFEAERTFPFPIKRIYYIYDVKKNGRRGYHAHKELKQVLWCPFGSVEIFMDNGVRTESFLLNQPNQLLVLGNGVWREMEWKIDNSVLCVAVSDYYDENDYIRDYTEFRKYVVEGFWANENKF